eukprot:CAMPEP_0172508584 /NCGR_PEP_ID=MMETSP1066-20121228/213096_1 /TAXON_ID=671091 /ORGANISM="Coscinodiscus wailesii, Strain CCMP2513" /LENGTH=94 /DNA_ID=CAMNT_0013286619 /DNA_START=624 /DNA_END=908 /DNA_ORIENTATION=+
MTTERLVALEKLGFTWNSQTIFDRAWMNKLKELQAFKAREGHCDVPRNHKLNLSLGKWVDNQRHQFKVFNEGGESHPTNERIVKLNDLGFKWVI